MSKDRAKTVLPKQAFLPLGIKNNKRAEAFGIEHLASVNTESEMAYNDTNLANALFRILAKQIDPQRVVLILESPVFPNKKDSIEEGECNWITSEMRRLGFTRWITADTRPPDPEWTTSYNAGMNFLKEFTNTYLEFSYPAFTPTGKTDFFDFPSPIFHCRKNIPKEKIAELKKNVFAVSECLLFEENIQRLFNVIEKKGLFLLSSPGVITFLH
jgi:hypothetical protein